MKYPLMLFVFLAVSSFVFGQISIKPKVGVVSSNLERPPSIDYGPGTQVSKIGYEVGAALEFPIKKRVALQVELLYNVKGLRDTTRIYSTTPTGNGYPYYKGYGYNFHYLELPVLIRLAVSNNFHLGVGPSVAYMLYADKVLDGKKMPGVKTNLSKMDYALNGDVAYSYKAFEIGARYTFSLGSVQYLGNPDIELFQPVQSIGKNRSLQIYLAYCIKK